MFFHCPPRLFHLKLHLEFTFGEIFTLAIVVKKEIRSHSSPL